MKQRIASQLPRRLHGTLLSLLPRYALTACYSYGKLAVHAPMRVHACAVHASSIAYLSRRPLPRPTLLIAQAWVKQGASVQFQRTGVDVTLFYMRMLEQPLHQDYAGPRLI